MYLGIDHQSGLVYEGSAWADLPAIPTPSVTLATLIQQPADWRALPSSLHQSTSSWVFQEDSFDAVTRTRRGRVYQPMVGHAQPSNHRVAPHPYQDPLGRTAGAGGRTNVSLHVFVACNALLDQPRQGQGMTLALGTPRAASAWRIVQTEVLVSQCVMVTLKALSAFGILPELALAKVPEDARSAVGAALGRVLDSAFRETPISVVDHCRNAMTVLLAHWMVQKGHDRAVLAKDLGAVVAAVGQSPFDKSCIAQLGHLIAWLHSRGKANEAHAKGLREPVEEDAELALQAVGFTLRELGWAA